MADFETFFMKRSEEMKGLENGLEGVKKTELFLQRQMKMLLELKKSLSTIIQKKGVDLVNAKKNLSQAESNVFDQIDLIVDHIHHQGLLLLEVTQQLEQAQIAKDVSDLVEAIKQEKVAASCSDSSDIIYRWYNEMKNYEKTFRNQQSLTEGVPDCLFFYPKLQPSQLAATHLGQNLSFSTRRKGFCIHVCIADERSKCDTSLHFRVTSDIAVDGLEININKCQAREESLQKVVHECIWTFIDSYFLPDS